MEKSPRFTKESFRQDRVLRLDGAMGTQIQGFGLAESDFRQGLPAEPTRDVKGDNECLNLSRPDVIRAIHRAYVDAGADIIETNSFGANAIVQGDYGLAALAPDMAFAAARLAREVADAAPRKVWVAGSMGPGSKSLSLVSDYFRPEWRPCSFAEISDAYKEQADALIRGGVDLILVETSFDALNVKAALYGVHRAQPGFPVIVSVSVSNGFGRTLTGQGLEAFYAAVARGNLMAFGLNCSMGAEGLLPLIRELAAWCPVPLICYPNAGLPNAEGAYDESPEKMAADMAGLDGLVNIIGGCCGTTPEHIRALPALKQRPIPEPEKCLKVSGLEAWTLGDGAETPVGMATNVAASPDFAGMLEREEFDEALFAASESVMEGVSVLDVNLDGLPETPALMEHFVRLTQSDPSVSTAALMIESSDWETLLQGLKHAQGKCIASAISLKEGESVFLAKADVLLSLGAALVIQVADEQGLASDPARIDAVCVRAFGLLTAAGIPPCELIFEVDDPEMASGIKAKLVGANVLIRDNQGQATII